MGTQVTQPPLPEAPPGAPRGKARVAAVVLLSVLLLLWVLVGLPVIAGMGLFWGTMTGTPIVIGPLTWVVATVVLVTVLTAVARGSWRPATAWVGVAALSMSFGIFPAMDRVALGRVCTTDRVARLESITPYGGQEIVPQDLGTPCGYTVDTSDPVDRVVRYYATELERGGWIVQETPRGSLIATKAGDRLSVEPIPPDQAGTVQVLAW